MRKLQTKDVFAVARLAKNADIKESFMKAYETGRNGEKEDAEMIGIDLLFSLLYSCSDVKVEKQFYEILADVMEVDAEAVQKQSIDETIKTMKEIAKENDLASFFGYVRNLMMK